MRVSEQLERLVRAATRRPAVTLAIVIVLALAGGALALRLAPSTGTDTFVSRSSSTYKVTAEDQSHFGGDPVVVMIREPLTDLLFTKELATETELEACLAGQTVVANAALNAFTPAPTSQPPYGGWISPCGQLMRMRAAQVVYGPGTFLNRAVAAVNTQVVTLEHQASTAEVNAGRAAYELALARKQSRAQALQSAQAAASLETQQQEAQLEQMALDSGITSLPSIDNQGFISQVVFDSTRGPYQPKARFAYLFPNQSSALIQVRLRASLTAAQQARAIALIRQAVRMPRFALHYGGTYTVSGAPVVLNDLAAQLTNSIAVLLAVAIVVMGIVLLLVFRRRPRLLPLAIALMAAGITFGLSSAVGASLTMASIAVVPVLIGLAVDYAVQFQSRVGEARQASGRAGAEAVVSGVLAGMPTIAAAALATAVGFLVLVLSPVPMVRGFAELLVVGIAIALLCAISAGSAVMVLAARGGGRRPWARAGRVAPWRRRRATRAAAPRGASAVPSRRATPAAPPGRTTGPPGPLSAAVIGAGELLALPARAVRDRGRAPVGRLVRAVLARPWPVLAVGAVLAVGGWVADTQTGVQSDVTKLVPSSMPALHDLRGLERLTGVSGEIDIVVHGRNVATPGTIAWMIRYEQSLFSHYGYVETRGCSASTVCPALSLPDLFSAGTQSASSAASGLSQSSINNLLDAVPAYFRQAVITPDRHWATLAFGIRLMPLGRQQQVIEYMRSQLRPPAGVTASLAGLPVLAAQADSALASSARRLITLLAGLIAVGLALGAVLRRPRRVVVPLVPIAMATGWSALILFVIGIPLNPMSASLGALVIAISTEFSVLLSERYRQERARGLALDRALARTYRSTGAAVLASGLTAIAGFGVLIASNIAMLRDFGFVTLIDLTVSLVGVLAVLPAVLAVSEGVAGSEGILWLRSTAAGLPWPRRRARVA